MSKLRTKNVFENRTENSVSRVTVITVVTVVYCVGASLKFQSFFTGLCGLCVFLLVTLLAVAIGLYFYCNEMVSNEHCRILNSVTEEVLLSAKSYGESALAMTEDVFRIAAKKCNGVAAWVIKSVSGEASQ